MKWINTFLLLLIVIAGAACSSAPFVESTDVCTIKRHYQDDLFQVYINDDVINKHWYLKTDAIAIAKDLASREKNKCSPESAAATANQ